MAKLYFRYSPMNSGKSLHLLQTANNYIEREMDVLLLKSTTDIRKDGEIYSRLGVSKEALGISSVEDVDKIISMIEDHPVSAVFLDEAQFVSKNIIDRLALIVDTYDIPVFCYGLKTDYKSELFEGSKRLLEIADSITELKSICKCGRKAIFNARLVDHADQVLIGQEDVYETMCRKCFNRRQI